MKYLEIFCPRILLVINHKIGNLFSNRMLSSENPQNHITTRKNHFYSSAGGVKMIFSSFKIFYHSRGFWKFKIYVFNGHINGQNPWVIWNMVRFLSQLHKDTCFHTLSWPGNHVWSLNDYFTCSPPIKSVPL